MWEKETEKTLDLAVNQTGSNTFSVFKAKTLTGSYNSWLLCLHCMPETSRMLVSVDEGGARATCVF